MISKPKYSHCLNWLCLKCYIKSFVKVVRECEHVCCKKVVVILDKKCVLNLENSCNEFDFCNQICSHKKEGVYIIISTMLQLKTTKHQFHSICTDQIYWWKITPQPIDAAITVHFRVEIMLGICHHNTKSSLLIQMIQNYGMLLYFLFAKCDDFLISQKNLIYKTEFIS